MRRARASPRGEPADRPQSTCALAELAWLSARPTRGALHSTPLAEASLHRHRARAAVAASKHCNQSFFLNAVAFKLRALRHVENQPTAHGARTARSAELAWLSSRPTCDALHPMPLADVLLYRHHARSAGTASKRRNQRVRIPWRAAHARFATWRTSRPPTEHVACALRTWRGCLRCQRGPRSTPPALTETPLHRHRARSTVAALKRRNQSF